VLARRHEAAALTAVSAPISAPQRVDLREGVRQWIILSRRYGELLWRDRWNLLILLAQAPVVGILLLLVISSNSYTVAGVGSTQQVLLMLTLAAIWFGTINAAREIVKERAIYLRERLATLRIWPYVLSKFGVLAVLCVGQSLVLLGIVTLKTPHLPAHGLLFPTWFEMAVSLILTSLAALAGGLLLSSLVVSADRAMSIVPIVLLAQVVFCGGVFDLNGSSSWLARLFISRWCLGVLGQSTGLNALAVQAHLIGWPKPLYGGGSGAHELVRWAVLLGWIVLFLIGTYWSLKRKDPHARRKR
jgi:ABC transport system ATP-binding/permease protein